MTTLHHRNCDFLLDGGPFRFFITRIDVARNSKTRIVRQHAVETFRRFVGAVGDGNLAGMERIANADTAAMVKRNPACAAGGIQQRIEYGPIGDGI